MRINYYFRSRNPRNNSIENLFNTIIKELPSQFRVKVIKAKHAFDWSTTLTIRNESADIHHITGAVNYFAFGLPKNKTVLTVHDVGFFENVSHSKLKRWIYGKIWFSIPLKRARVVTVVSEFTKAKLIRYFNVDEAKIHVIGNPVLPHFKPQELRLPAGIIKILHIGSGDHKNFKGLLEAARNLPVHIVKIGATSAEENDLITRYKISIEHHVNLSDEAVSKFYNEADVLYFASFYEGFGMPIIEAQTVGKPVITSNLGAMKEIAMDSAILVDPCNVGEIRQGIVSLMEEEEMYKQLVQKGRKNAVRFSLAAVVCQYVKIYNEIGI